jgi:sec-independent protein translocase protein TatB
MLSPSDTAIVFLVALLLFGPEQLPRIARQLGDAMRHMQSATNSFMAEMDRAARTHEMAVTRQEPLIAPAPPAAPIESPAETSAGDAQADADVEKP